MQFKPPTTAKHVPVPPKAQYRHPADLVSIPLQYYLIGADFRHFQTLVRRRSKRVLPSFRRAHFTLKGSSIPSSVQDSHRRLQYSFFVFCLFFK